MNYLQIVFSERDKIFDNFCINSILVYKSLTKCRIEFSISFHCFPNTFVNFNIKNYNNNLRTIKILSRFFFLFKYSLDFII